MIEFLLGYFLGSSKRRAGDAGARMTVAGLAGLAQMLLPLACGLFMAMLVLPLLTDGFPDILGADWGLTQRVCVAFGVLVANLMAGTRLRNAAKRL